MKANKQTPEILDYVLSCFREKFGDGILGGDVKFLPDEAFVEVSVREKEAEILEFGRMIEAEFDELGRRVTVFVKGSADYAD